MSHLTSTEASQYRLENFRRHLARDSPHWPINDSKEDYDVPDNHWDSLGDDRRIQRKQSICYVANVSSGGTAVYGKDGSILYYNMQIVAVHELLPSTI